MDEQLASQITQQAVQFVIVGMVPTWFIYKERTKRTRLVIGGVLGLLVLLAALQDKLGIGIVAGTALVALVCLLKPSPKPAI